MTVSEFLAATVRLGAIVLPAVVASHCFRVRRLGLAGAVGALADAVLTLALLLAAAEVLGLVSLDRAAPLIAVLIVVMLASRFLLRRRELPPAGATASSRSTGREPDAASPSPHDAVAVAATVAVAVVAAQWCLATANSLGSGMTGFDTLWYHMPFAARFAQTHSVSEIVFTQADPFVAYYPANAELLHAIGIVALHNDFLSPFLNLGWLCVALLASWCFGRPWRLERQTLLAGCVACSLPVLATTQPGQALNDIAGLAMLLAGVAIAVNAPQDMRLLPIAGLALGWAAGTKFTFLVPAIVVIAGLAIVAPAGARLRVLASLALPALLTGGWWYLRNLLKVGNPLGLQVHVGPIRLRGPASALADELRETVVREMTRGGLWSTRIVPGFDHALGPLWGLLLALYLVTTVAAVALGAGRTVRVVGAAAGLTGLSYLVLPVGASGGALGSTLFEVQQRFLVPALALALLLVPVLVRQFWPRALPALAGILATIVVVSQLEHALWPTQPVRHLVFLAAALGVVAIVYWAARQRRRLSLVTATTATLVLLLAVGTGAFAVQRHYFNRRYKGGYGPDRGLGQIYRWAQGVKDQRIALYGTVLQYPLYGARDSNYVGYLGNRVPNGGFRPIASCETWRATINAGAYQWLVVVLPGPTPAVPISWSEGDPALRLFAHPEAGAFVYKVHRKLDPAACS